MQYVNAGTFVGVLLSLTSCTGGVLPEDMPARINSPTAESRAELLNAVRDALNGSEIILADDALTKESLLIIEPKLLLGRDLRKPVHFRLVLSGSDCVLVHQVTQARTKLSRTECIAE